MIEGEDEFEDFDEGEDEGDEENDKPTAVFVGVGHGGAGTDEAFGIISGVCDRLSLEPLRVSADRPLGTPKGDEAVREFLEAADFAIIDLSHKRPTLAREVAMVEAEFDAVFILLAAKTGTPLPAAIEDKKIAYYADKGDLRAIVERQLNAMTDAWHEMEEEDEDEEEDIEDDED
jgi:hypothetical protein